MSVKSVLVLIMLRANFGLFFLQVELATGEYPYRQYRTSFEQLGQILNGPSPTLPEGGPYSERLRDFVAQWSVIVLVIHVSFIFLLVVFTVVTVFFSCRSRFVKS